MIIEIRKTVLRSPLKRRATTCNCVMQHRYLCCWQGFKHECQQSRSCRKEQIANINMVIADRSHNLQVAISMVSRHLMSVLSVRTMEWVRSAVGSLSKITRLRRLSSTKSLVISRYYGWNLRIAMMIHCHTIKTKSFVPSMHFSSVEVR